MTVHEIARLAGVSIGTVDRVLHKRGRVSAATRKRVEAIIEQYRFTPNPIARRLKLNRPYRFCALIPRRDQDAGYWGQIIAGIERAAAEIKPLGIETKIIEFDRYDPAAFEKVSASVCGGAAVGITAGGKTIGSAEDRRGEGSPRNTASLPDGLLFAPIMPKQARPFVETICSEKIPLVFVDADMPGTAPLCVIGQAPFSGGYLAGRLFHLFAGKVTKPVAVLDAHGEDYHITRRRDGFLRYAQEHGFPVIVREYSGYEGAEISVEEIARFLKEHSDLSGLFITNCMAHRAAQAAAQLPAATRRKNDRPFLLVGYDLIPDNQRLLLEGRIDAIISQRPEEQGREALLTLFHSVVLGQQVEPRREIPLDVYLRENTPPLNFGNTGNPVKVD